MNTSSTRLVPVTAAAAAWTGLCAELGPLWLTLGGAWPLPALVFVGLWVGLLHGAGGALVAWVLGDRLGSRGLAAGVGTLTSVSTTLILLGFLGSGPPSSLLVAVALSVVVLAAITLRLGRGSGSLLLVPPAALAIGWLSAVSDPVPSSGPSVLIVTVQGARADRYGSAEVDTPAYDALARDGVVFLSAVAPSTEAQAAAQRVFGGQEGAEPLAVELSAAGLHTAAFVSSRSLSRSAGVASGFDVYDDDLRWVRGLDSTSAGGLFSLVSEAPEQRRAGDTVDRALGWVGSVQGPWMAWVDLADPLAPFEPPIPWDERYTRGLDGRHPHATGMPPASELEPATAAWLAGITDPLWVVGRYEGEIGYTEHHLARLVSAVPPDTVVVLVGLFGTSLGDDGHGFGHRHLGEAALDVPAVLRAPGVPPEVRAAPVSIAELPGWVRAARRGEPPPPPWLPAKATHLTPTGCAARERTESGWRPTGC